MNVCVGDDPAGFTAVGEGRRAGAATLESAISRIERAVAGSCAEQAVWPAGVAAGLNAVIEFLIANPGTARALAIGSRSAADQPLEDADYDEMIGRFALMLGAGAPRSGRLPGSSDHAVVAVIAAVVARHIRAGTIDSLAEGDPDLLFLALLPYLGFAEAARWSSIPER